MSSNACMANSDRYTVTEIYRQTDDYLGKGGHAFFENIIINKISCPPRASCRKQTKRIIIKRYMIRKVVNAMLKNNGKNINL